MKTTTAKNHTLHATRNDIPAESRARIVKLLNARLADTTDYAMRLKQAHWNVRGANFIALHEMFDTFVTEAQGYADLIAERAVSLGGQALGTVEAVKLGTSLPEYPLHINAANDHLKALADGCGRLAAAIREGIDEATKLEDMDTADIFTEASRGLDKQLWYLEAHLS